MELENMKILVTGGASGIAAATVKRYAKEGAIVSSIDIQDEKGKKIADEANKMAQGPGKVTYVHCDISHKDEVDKAFAQAKKDMGGFDMLAHIAAKMAPPKPALDFTPEDIAFIFDNDMYGTIYTNQAACHLMQEYGTGIIVNYGSETGIHGSPHDALYSAAKAGVATWTRTIAKEWGHAYNIRCNTVLPTIATDMYRAYVNSMGEEERAAFLESRRQKHPIGGDMGDPDEDMAPVMVFLASEKSKYITGQLFAVNGGNTMLTG